MNLQTWKVLIESSRGLSIFPVFDLQNRLSLDEINLSLPPGAYTTFRTYNNNQTLLLNDHFERLKETAILSGYELHFSNALVRMALREILAQRLPDKDLRIRVTLLFQSDLELYISIEDLELPSVSSYQGGVKVETRSIQRINPKAKRTDFIATANLIRQSLPSGINEVIMLDDSGYYLEGLSSNFFIVINNEIWTAEEGVLSGLTRKTILSLLDIAHIPIHFERVHSSVKLQEAFITSVSRGVLPIRQIDSCLIGEPGVLTCRVRNLYLDLLDHALENI
jgi:branched-chain amino acid aminotransferase